jgi:Tol biopolymer transport system component
VNFSPDGRYIAYDFPTEKRSTSDRDIYVRELATGRETVIVEHPASDYLLGWAPDGKHILFGSDRGGTRGAWLVGVAEGKAVGEPALVKPDLWGMNEGSFIPDGSFFYNVVSGMLGLYVANLDPATGKVIGAPTLMPRSGEQNELRPEWSPDGLLVATVANRDRAPASAEWSIRIWSVDKGEYRDFPLPAEFREVSAIWASDGRSVLVRSLQKSQFSVHRLDVQSGKLEPVFTLPPAVQLGLMRVKADGHTLVYFTGEPAKDGLTTRSIILRDLSTGAERTVCRRTGKPTGGRRLYGALSPDGSTRASLLLEDSTKNGLLQIETIDQLCTGEPTTLVTMPHNKISGFPGIGWSPDSRSLTFLRRLTQDPDPREELWRISVDGGIPERLGLSMAGLTAQTISRDGRRMAFIGGESRDELWVMTNILPSHSSPATPK